MGKLTINSGWLQQAVHKPSPNFNRRPDSKPVSLLVVHNISLPPGKFDGDYISDFFLNQLDPKAHPYFADIYQMQVSAHCLIRRDGAIIQYVGFDERAWHAGVSEFCGQSQCNDFSIGIELEGTDELPYEHAQYQALAALTQALCSCYPELANVVGHNDIAPGRKTDPGNVFDWRWYLKITGIKSLNNPYLKETL